MSVFCRTKIVFAYFLYDNSVLCLTPTLFMFLKTIEEEKYSKTEEKNKTIKKPHCHIHENMDLH